jgi:5-methylthioadenosine/S-adenosylhomocysteine deaminase
MYPVKDVITDKRLIVSKRPGFLVLGTSGGAATTPYGSHISTLAVAKAADLVPIDWDKLAHRYLDLETLVFDAVVQRAKGDGVDLVMVAGEVVYEGGRFTRVDRDEALRDLHESLQHALAEDELDRRQLSKALLPHVQRFYAGYFDPEAHAPYYQPSSRV